MVTQDTSEIKAKIMSVFEKKGPCLPVHIAKETGLSILFASAFLSELFTEKKINMSNMRVGSSPIYFISEQKFMLEKFSIFLKSKEKEAFILLKEKKFLKDREQQPAIRVALRSIKDFAVPFREDDEIHWRYFNVSESELKKSPEPKRIAEKSEKPKETQKQIKKEPKAKKIKQNEKFLEKVKEFLSKSSVEINSIESIGKNELILKVKDNEEERLLIAYNKKRITEKEIIKASKKAEEFNLKYSIISLGKLPKKTSDLINALQNMIYVEKLE